MNFVTKFSSFLFVDEGSQTLPTSLLPTNTALLKGGDALH